MWQDTEIVETIEDSDLQTVDNNDPSANGEGSTSVPSQTEPQPTGSKTKTVTGSFLVSLLWGHALANVSDDDPIMVIDKHCK